MKRTTRWLSLIALTGLLGLSAPEASAINNAASYGTQATGTPVTECRDASPFESIVVSQGITLELTQADTYRVEVTADRDLLPYLQTEISRHTLNIGYSDGLSLSKRMPRATVRVSMPQLETLCASTQARILVQETFSASSLDIVLSSGALVQGTFVCDALNAALSTQSKLQFANADIGSLQVAASTRANVGGSLRFDDASITATSGATLSFDKATGIDFRFDGSTKARMSGTLVCEEITLTASNAVHIQLDTLSFGNMTASLTMNSTLQGAATSGEELTLNATFDSTVDLQGTCRSLMATASMWSHLRLLRLTCERAELSAMMSSAISCTAHESLSAQALQNSRITYAGNPPQKILNSGIGSTIRKQRAQQYARHHRYTTHPRTL